MEYEFKWKQTEPRKGSYNWDVSDKAMEILEKNK